MANIKVCCVFLFISIWLTEAYSGKRYKREFGHQGDKAQLLDVENSLVETGLVAAADGDDELTEEKDDTWVGLAITFARLAKPYIPGQVYNLNLDWPQLVVALRSLEAMNAGVEADQRSSGGSSLETAIRAATAAAAPMLMDGVRVVLGMMLEVIDQAAFATSGHSVKRRSADREDVIDDLMNAITAIVTHVTGYQRTQYHDIDDV